MSTYEKSVVFPLQSNADGPADCDMDVAQITEACRAVALSEIISRHDDPFDVDLSLSNIDVRSFRVFLAESRPALLCGTIVEYPEELVDVEPSDAELPGEG